MKHTYKVTGMTCGGCTSAVEKTLDTIHGITKATVSLPETAEVEMDSHVPIETMQEALKKVGRYQIVEVSELDASREKINRKSCCAGNDKSEKEMNAKNTVL